MQVDSAVGGFKQSWFKFYKPTFYSSTARYKYIFDSTMNFLRKGYDENAVPTIRTLKGLWNELNKHIDDFTWENFNLYSEYVQIHRTSVFNGKKYVCVGRCNKDGNINYGLVSDIGLTSCKEVIPCIFNWDNYGIEVDKNGRIRFKLGVGSNIFYGYILLDNSYSRPVSLELYK